MPWITNTFIRNCILCSLVLSLSSIYICLETNIQKVVPTTVQPIKYDTSSRNQCSKLWTPRARETTDFKWRQLLYTPPSGFHHTQTEHKPPSRSTHSWHDHRNVVRFQRGSRIRSESTISSITSSEAHGHFPHFSQTFVLYLLFFHQSRIIYLHFFEKVV